MPRSPWSCLLIAIVVAACSGRGGPPTFTATFPAATDGEYDAISVSLIDQTGLVTGMSLAPTTAGASGVTSELGDANAVRVDWLGTGCDGRVSLVFVDAGGTYTLNLHTDPTVVSGFGCPDEDVPRAITIKLRQPVEPGRITISRQYP